MKGTTCPAPEKLTSSPRARGGGQIQAEVDFACVTGLQQEIWSKGDFAHVAPIVQAVADRLVESVDVLPGDRVLDVACGSGNTAIAAARCFADVTGIDFVSALLERGRVRAAAEFLDVQFVEGDAQALPFEDGSFDVVLSTFGAMFAADQERTADELLRVTRPGGTIGMANWVPDSFVGDVFRAPSEYARRHQGWCLLSPGGRRSGFASCSATASPTFASSDA